MIPKEQLKHLSQQLSRFHFPYCICRQCFQHGTEQINFLKLLFLVCSNSCLQGSSQSLKILYLSASQGCGKVYRSLSLGHPSFLRQFHHVTRTCSGHKYMTGLQKKTNQQNFESMLGNSNGASFLFWCSDRKSFS